MAHSSNPSILKVEQLAWRRAAKAKEGDEESSDESEIFDEDTDTEYSDDVHAINGLAVLRKKRGNLWQKLKKMDIQILEIKRQKMVEQIKEAQREKNEKEQEIKKLEAEVTKCGATKKKIEDGLKEIDAEILVLKGYQSPEDATNADAGKTTVLPKSESQAPSTSDVKVEADLPGAYNGGQTRKRGGKKTSQKKINN